MDTKPQEPRIVIHNIDFDLTTGVILIQVNYDIRFTHDTHVSAAMNVTSPVTPTKIQILEKGSCKINLSELSEDIQALFFNLYGFIREWLITRERHKLECWQETLKNKYNIMNQHKQE